MYDNFAKYCLSYGGTILPLLIPSEAASHLGICNPSIFFDDGKIRLILRNVNYTLWCCNNDYSFTSLYGPLYYIVPDNDNHLRTCNFLCELSYDRKLSYKYIDTSKNDYEPLWEFVGHEDMRLVRWNGKLYGTGVQRDWNDTGIGRMHLSELNENTGEEITRVRIEAPNDKDSYCEKNWMPILDMPYHYVKWCNPLEIVKVNHDTGDSETVLIKEYSQNIDNLNTDGMDMRGSSQVIPYKDGMRIALVHKCRLWINEKNEKSGTGYFTQFVVWDNEWNIVKVSEPFNFNGFSVEFTNGLAYHDGIFYIPFSLQDNFSFLLAVPGDVVHDFIFNGNRNLGDYYSDGGSFLNFFYHSGDSQAMKNMGDEYFADGHYAASAVCYEKGCEYNTFANIDELYGCMYMVGLSLQKIGGRDKAEESVWMKLIDLCPNRSEGYLMLSQYYGNRDKFNLAYTFAKLAYEKNNVRIFGGYTDIDNDMDCLLSFVFYSYYTEHYKECEKMADLIFSNKEKLTSTQIRNLESFKGIIESNKENIVRIL